MSLTRLNELIEIAKRKNQVKRIAIAAADDVFVLKAVLRAKELGLIVPIFIGNSKNIHKIADTEKLTIEEANIIDAETPRRASEIAVELVRNNQADLLMKGLVPTRVLLREVLNKEYGLLNSSLLSHLAIFESPYYHKIFGLTDAAMNIAPTLNEKIEIITNATRALQKLGVKYPKVALLAAIEFENPKMQDTVDASLLVQMNRTGTIRGCTLEGPLALDIAISDEAAKHKGFQGVVAGNADLLVVPEIVSGNILYKSLTYLGGARTAGVLLGTISPLIFTSRADSEESKLFSIALAICLSE